MTNDELRNAIITTLEDTESILARGWCQHATAIDTNGKTVSPTDESAVARCVIGGIMTSTRQRFDDTKIIDVVCGHTRAAIIAHIGDLVSVWNDRPERTKEEVVAMVREVRAKAQSGVIDTSRPS